MREVSEVMIFTFASAKNIIKIGLLFLRNKTPLRGHMEEARQKRKGKVYPRKDHEDPEGE